MTCRSFLIAIVAAFCGAGSWSAEDEPEVLVTWTPIPALETRTDASGSYWIVGAGMDVAILGAIETAEGRTYVKKDEVLTSQSELIEVLPGKPFLRFRQVQDESPVEVHAAISYEGVRYPLRFIVIPQPEPQPPISIEVSIVPSKRASIPPEAQVKAADLEAIDVDVDADTMNDMFELYCVPEDGARLVVTATYADGRVVDVSASTWTRYFAGWPTLSVNPSGVILPPVVDEKSVQMGYIAIMHRGLSEGMYVDWGAYCR